MNDAERAAVAQTRKDADRSLTDRAYVALEEMICTLRLEPGEVLSEGALSETLRIGRTPVREALQRLAREGLVTVLPRRGVLVSEFNVKRQLRMLEVRRELNQRAPAEGPEAYKLSVNDFVIRALALALGRVPAANASWTEAAIRRYRAVDVSVAVAIPDGLITPVVRNAGTKGLATISREMRDLAARARAGKLTPEEYQGGTVSVSNLGMYGIREFSAVINPPQGAILAVGAGEKRPVVKDDALAVATVMSCTLSADHRVVDGVIGANLLKVFKSLIEDPLTMLL